MGLWGLHLLVYLSVTLALGTIVGHRGPVAAIGLGALLAGEFLGGLVPGPVLTSCRGRCPTWPTRSRTAGPGPVRRRSRSPQT